MARNEPARPRDRSQDRGRSEIWRDADSSWTLSVELLTATFVWGGIGWLVDTYVLHSSPYAMIVGFLIGFALGMYLLYLRMQADGRREDEARARWRDR